MATGPRLQTGSVASQAQEVQSNTLTVSSTNVTTHNAGTNSLNRKMVVYGNTYKISGGGGGPTLSCTYNGVSMNKFGEVSSPLGGAAHLVSAMFFLDEADLPATDGTSHDIVLTASGGNNYLTLAAAQFRNVDQGNPSVGTGENTDGVSVASVVLPHAIDYLTTIGFSFSNDVAPFTYNNLQQEIAGLNNTTGNSSLGFTYINEELSISPAHTATGQAPAAATHGTAFTWAPVFDPRVQLAATVSATSTVGATLNRFKFFITSIVATSTSSADLQRDRGYVTTVAATSTVTPTVVRTVRLLSITNAAATITAQPFERAAELRTLIEPFSTVTSVFDVTRPLAATTAGQLTVSASFANTFAESQYSPTPGDYVELFEIDTTVIGGADVFRFIPHRFETPDVEVEWKGETFIQFPVDMEGFEITATGAAPAQPKMRIANVNKFILAAVLSLGDIVGAKVTRWRTYARFLDNGETPDSNAHYAPDIYYVQQKTGHSREGFEFILSSALDLPGIKLPRRQILKDQSSDDRNLYAPGVANVRFRGR